MKELMLEADLNIYNAARMKSMLLELLNQNDELAVVLSPVKNIDTAGFQVLYLLKRQAFLLSKKLIYTQHSDAVIKIFDLYGVIGLFQDKIKMNPELRAKLKLKYGLKKQNFSVLEQG